MQRIELSYTRPQLEIFFNIPEDVKFLVVTKGRRFGATKGAANACIEWCLEGDAILWGDTISGNIDRYVERYFKPELIKANIKYTYSTQKKVMTIGNGYIDFRSADRPENWEGFGYNKIFLNEAGIILKNDYLYTNAVLPMLMDYPNSVLIAAGVPKGMFLKGSDKEHKFYSLYKKAKEGLKGYRVLEYSSYDNPLLSKEDVEELSNEIKTMNPQMQEQEIYGKFVEGAAGELWDEVIIEKCRTKSHPPLKRIVVSIDPATTKKKKSDETGITVQGICHNNKGYFLENLTGKYSPNEWGSIAVNASVRWDADCIVGESNQGGDMVKSIIETVLKEKNVIKRVKLVHATKGKFVRAEPIYALYEQGNIFHVGYHTKLENQMTTFTSDYAESPNDVDALVWGFTELMITAMEWDLSRI